MTFKTLEFVLPDIIICLNGTLPDTHTFHRLRSIPIAAADGAAIQLRQKGILPQSIIGDLDSFASDRMFWQEYQDVTIHEVNDQNSTDFEKTLEYVRRQNYRTAMILGMHGGEFDHTLNNWSILMRYGKILHLAFYEKGTIAVPIYESVTITTRPGEMISLIPQPSTIITTSGLEWNLQKEELALGKREGARNRATEVRVKIQVHSGSLLLFLNNELPYMPQI